MTEGAGTLNLAPKRGPNVWDKREWDYAQLDLNTERWLLGLAGVGLAAFGLNRGPLAGGLFVLGGATLAYRAARGHNDLSSARDWIRHWFERSERRVEGESEESFPASDPPSWTPTAGTKQRARSI